MASSILSGLYMGEALLIAESGASLGMMQVAITASVMQIPFFVAACDYVIIGEELAGILSGPVPGLGVSVSDIYGNYIGKWMTVVSAFALCLASVNLILVHSRIVASHLFS